MSLTADLDALERRVAKLETVSRVLHDKTIGPLLDRVAKLGAELSPSVHVDISDPEPPADLQPGDHVMTDDGPRVVTSVKGVGITLGRYRTPAEECDATVDLVGELRSLAAVTMRERDEAIRQRDAAWDQTRETREQLVSAIDTAKRWKALRDEVTADRDAAVDRLTTRLAEAFRERDEALAQVDTLARAMRRLCWASTNQRAAAVHHFGEPVALLLYGADK